MRKFTSYGPINRKIHYYVPREKLINKTHQQLLGEIIEEGGHYITIWAPRQTGKTGILQQVLWRLQKDERFDVLKINLEQLEKVRKPERVIKVLLREISRDFNIDLPKVHDWEEFQEIFSSEYLKKPLILIIDEFDSLESNIINGIAKVFRNIYMTRNDDQSKTTRSKR